MWWPVIANRRPDPRRKREQLGEAFVGQPDGVGEARLRLGVRGLAAQQLPVCDRPAYLLDAPGQRIELPADAGQVAALEHHVNPPEVGPHLRLGVRGFPADLQQLCGQYEPLVGSVRIAAHKLAGS
jgi:hypothetical protein